MAEINYREVLDQIPPGVRFSGKDAEALQRNSEIMLSWGEDLAQGFYHQLFAHETTRAVFHEGERPLRERTFREWYRRTVEGPFDDKYWNWQILVGIAHIKRRVNNAMVAGMWGWVLNYISSRAIDELPSREAQSVIYAMQSLQAIVMALIAESYARNMFVAIEKASGISEALAQNLIATEIDSVLESAKAKG